MLWRYGVKLAMNGSVLIPFLYFVTDASVTQIVMSCIVFSVIAFLVGDQLILRYSNNTVATLADFGLTGLFFWIVAGVYRWSLSGLELFLTAALAGFVEAMFHRILAKWDLTRTAFSPRD
jgi:hypothetical protein